MVKNKIIKLFIENAFTMEKLILTESDLHTLVMESVKRIINEIGDTPKGQYMLGRLDGRYIKRMHDAEDEEERMKMWQKANDINDYASKQIHPEKYDGIDDEEEIYSSPTAYRLGYKDELGGTTGIDKMFSITGHKNNLNNPEKDAEFRKKYLDGVNIA